MKTDCAIGTIEELIRKRISEKGPITFSEFMEIALYHPNLGYYSRSEVSEDYYTNVDVHPIFSDILAQFFYKEWENHFKNEQHFYIVEMGCGSGKLAQNILAWLSCNAPDCFQNLTYLGIERSVVRQKSCEKLKSLFPKQVEFNTEFDFPNNSISGIIFSNEFFDALPVHRVILHNERLEEIFIDKNFREIFAEPARAVCDYIKWLNVKPTNNCVGEIHLEARKHIKKIAKALRKGIILTLDYGFEVQELYSDLRPEGTALCHFQHRTNRNFYDNMGTQDITAHVNFTTLIKEAKMWGLESLPLKTQSQFLLENGADAIVAAMQSSKEPRSHLKTSSAIKSLVHPEGLGGTFKVLLQMKY